LTQVPPRTNIQDVNNKFDLEVSESARRAGVSADTMRAWVDSGKVEAIRTARGVRLIDEESLERLIAERRERRAR